MRVTILVLVCLGVVVLTVVVVLWRARELANRLICAGNMQMIATTSRTYVSSYPGEGPPSLDWLVEQGAVTRAQTICPSSGLTESNYVLVPFKAGVPLDNTTIIMYEPKSNHGGEGGNFVFADGHASFAEGKAYDELVSTTRGRVSSGE